MRGKFVIGFHECLREAGIDEDKFIEIIKCFFKECEESQKGTNEDDPDSTYSTL